MYQMIPLYVSETKIYHFSTKFLQFGQITDLKPIDSVSDIPDPFVWADVAQQIRKHIENK
jgi:hypothetical protein